MEKRLVSNVTHEELNHIIDALLTVDKQDPLLVNFYTRLLYESSSLDLHYRLVRLLSKNQKDKSLLWDTLYDRLFCGPENPQTDALICGQLLKINHQKIIDDIFLTSDSEPLKEALIDRLSYEFYFIDLKALDTFTDGAHNLYWQVVNYFENTIEKLPKEEKTKYQELYREKHKRFAGSIPVYHDGTGL